MNQRGSLLLGKRPSPTLGVIASVAATAAITALIYPLRTLMPEAACGVLYLLAVLVISTYWGLALGLFTSLLGAAAFNFFHIPPTGGFTIAETQNWVALGVFLATAVIASSVAELARSRADEAERRRREAELTATMARLLLGGPTVETTLEPTAAELARALGIEAARIVLGHPGNAAEAAGEWAPIALEWEGEDIGTLLIQSHDASDTVNALRERIVPALETLLAAALERERLQHAAVETGALRRSDVLKTALLRSVSHDLRTPLTAIVAASEPLGSASLSEEERRELAAAVSDEAARLAHMVDQLLDLSRLEAGAAEPQRDWCSIQEIAQAALDQADGSGQHKLGVDPSTPLILADAAQLERALANVIENAVRHSDGRPVSVKARPVGSRLMIRVVDQGRGVPERDLERIFDAFYQGEQNGSRSRSGSGLGLAIAKGFVEANGGRIWAESLPGQGTVIVIALPLEPVPEPSGGAPAVPVEP